MEAPLSERDSSTVKVVDKTQFRGQMFSREGVGYQRAENSPQERLSHEERIAFYAGLAALRLPLPLFGFLDVAAEPTPEDEGARRGGRANPECVACGIRCHKNNHVHKLGWANVGVRRNRLWYCPVCRKKCLK